MLLSKATYNRYICQPPPTNLLCRLLELSWWKPATKPATRGKVLAWFEWLPKPSVTLMSAGTPYLVLKSWDCCYFYARLKTLENLDTRHKSGRQASYRRRTLVPLCGRPHTVQFNIPTLSFFLYSCLATAHLQKYISFTPLRVQISCCCLKPIPII